MVARAFTVSKSGRKRLASSGVSVYFMESSARLTSRQKLLALVGADGSQDYMGEEARRHTRTVRRLLRAHERDIAERAVAWSREVNRPQHVDIATAIRAAILGPPAAGTRKRRTK